MNRFTSLMLIFTFFFTAARFGFRPTITVDAADPQAEMGHYAAGCLYGLAEEGVPDPVMTESLGITSVSQKVIDGLQHPIGDVDHVIGQLPDARYVVVYLQDGFSTWYYDEGNIVEARRNGTYDPVAYTHDVFFPIVREKVEKLRDKPYADRLVYCPFNECDNGVWYGTFMGDSWSAFDDAGRQRFYAAWKETCALIRELDPNAVIGGPGYMDYNREKLESFLSYCIANDCLPDVMIYHELNGSEDWNSANWWRIHAEEYRELETSLGLEPLPVIVTEYGAMDQCGAPAQMFKYVKYSEETQIYGNIAYWRLADNLCDLSADGVEPNSCWWLYRWYAQMQGQRLGVTVTDLFHADFGKAVKEGRPLRYKHWNALASLSDDAKALDILTSGADYSGDIRVANLDKTNLGRKVSVTVEAVAFEGLSGSVYAPTTVARYNANVTGGALRIPMEKMDPNAVYRVTLRPAGDGAKCRLLTRVETLGERYEFEDGTLIGNAYTYDSAYATTGQTQGMVGGMEQPGDGVALRVRVPSDETYDLTFIYGKHGDGQGPAGRVTGRIRVTVDDRAQTVDLPNTIKSEYTDTFTLTMPLSRGAHTVTAEHLDGTFVLDSLLVRQHTQRDDVFISGEGAARYAVVPSDGYYSVDADPASVTLDGMALDLSKGKTLYLRRGLARIECAPDAAVSLTRSDRDLTIQTVAAQEMTLTPPAAVSNGVLTGITSEGGAAAMTVSAPEAGVYRLTFTYANNQEGGYHAYNVDLIEAYVTVTTDAQQKRLWCRSTCSDETFTTATIDLTLNAGDNVIRLSNDGSVRFDGRVSAAPLIRSVSVHPIQSNP